MITNKRLKQQLTLDAQPSQSHPRGVLNVEVAEAIYEMGNRYFKGPNFAGQYWKDDLASHAIVETLAWVGENLQKCADVENPYALIMSKLREYGLEFAKRENQHGNA